MRTRATLVLFDEDCGICSALARRLSSRGVAVAGLGSPVASGWLRDLAPRERYRTFHAIDDRGRRHSGGAAVPLALHALGRHRAARAAAAMPGVTEALYRAVARSRRLLSLLLGPRACRPPGGKSAQMP